MDMNRESWEPYLDGSQTQVEHRSGSFNTVSTRQLYISNQMNRARKKLAELQEMSILLWSSSFTSGRQISTRASEIDDSVASVDARDDQPVNAEDPESNTVRDTLGHVFREIERDIETLNTRVRDEIHGLNSRIQKLERQRRSSWVMGLSDEGPPGYSE
ncbi:hypothetical protein K438DRAFT_493678 [Mycena galopus ATCC 62051]|nr:hypothetical protein K438DRAFT_493678 [Mycena galopus ATCC 62051]